MTREEKIKALIQYELDINLSDRSLLVEYLRSGFPYSPLDEMTDAEINEAYNEIEDDDFFDEIDKESEEEDLDLPDEIH